MALDTQPQTTKQKQEQGHGHSHANFSSAAARNSGRLKISLALTTTFFFAEVIGGLIANSLALLADAAHMLTDVLGTTMALLAIWFAQRPATPSKTYGYYRVEILAALANGLVLFGVSGYILFEAWKRFQEPPEVQSGVMMIVAALGLIVNMISVWLLFSASKESLNMKGAFYEVVSDALGSVGVIIAGAVMFFTGWYYADPIFSVLIGLFIIPRTWRLMRSAIDVLLEATPAHLDLTQMEADIKTVASVREIHDLHAWTLTSGVEALSAHIWVDKLTPGYDVHQTLCDIRDMLHEKYGIDHATLQIEEESLVAQEGKM